LSFSFGLSHQNPVHVPPLSHACHMPRPSHSPLYDLSNDIWWWVQIMKLPILQLSPFSRYFIPVRSKYSQHPVLKNPSLCSSLNVRDQVSHPYKTTRRIMVLYILTFKFLDNRREDRRLWTER
jgi:hypothetical protein